MCAANLLDTNGSSPLSDDISIIHEITEWVDEESPGEQLSFYRIEEIK